MVRFGLIASLLMFATQGTAGPIKKEIKSDYYAPSYYSLECASELHCSLSLMYRESDESGKSFTLSMSVANFVQRTAEAQQITATTTRISLSHIEKMSPWHDRCDVKINGSFKASGDLDSRGYCVIESEPLMIYLISEALNLDNTIGSMWLDFRTYEEDNKSDSSNYEVRYGRLTPTLPEEMLNTFESTNLFYIFEAELGVILHDDAGYDEAYFEYVRPKAW